MRQAPTFDRQGDQTGAADGPIRLPRSLRQQPITQQRKNFIPRNEGFVCDRCGFSAPPAQATFRNHCPVCLASKHVDGPTPGDRNEECGGLMPAITVEGVDPDALDLVHRCDECGFTRRNKIASDDNREAIVTLMKQK